MHQAFCSYHVFLLNVGVKSTSNSFKKKKKALYNSICMIGACFYRARAAIHAVTSCY
jgi:hypothetical protein